MLKPLKLLILVALAAGAYYLFTRYQVQGLDGLKLNPRETSETSQPSEGGWSPASNQPFRKTIRLATANFGPLDGAKLAKPHLVGRLVQLLRQFDLVALQDIQARDQGVLVQLLEQVNAAGRHYRFATSPSVGRELVRQYNAFVYDEETILIDRSTIALVDNPAGRFCHPPLVASFRARGPGAHEAFTFTLINVHIPSDRVATELDWLASVFRAVRDDGRSEDDIILLGDLGADDTQLGQLARVPNLTSAISGIPTLTRGTRQVDNILFDRRATVEFTRRAGVVDLMREFNISLREAVETSEHLPVWAEFSVFEGGQAGQVSDRP